MRIFHKAPMTLTRASRADVFQYGHVTLCKGNEISKYFRVGFDFMIEPTGSELHAMVWFGLFGYPEKESSSRSNMFPDGGTRVLVMKRQRTAYDDKKNILAVAMPDANHEQSWDVVRELSTDNLPVNRWIRMSFDVFLAQKKFRVLLDDLESTFDAPEIPSPGGELYIGGKTLLGTGIQIKNIVLEDL
jgi:hypothetical protein